MSQRRRRQPKYRHVVPALVLMTTVAAAMTGITVSRLARIPAQNSVSVPPAAARVQLVGVPRAEAAKGVSARRAAARDAEARGTTSVPEAASPNAADPAPIVEAESPTLPLSAATLKVGLAAARSLTLAAASPRPAPPAECDGPIVENYDADIAGMTGLPGRKMYYARAQKKAISSMCRREAQAASSTP